MKETTITGGDLIIVQDMSSYADALDSGYLTQEEFDATFGNEFRKGKFNTPEGEAFLAEYGDTIPFFTGGSDAGIIEGHSNFKTKRFLQLEKLGLVEKATLPSQQFIYDYGHIFETDIGRFCAGKMRRNGIDVVYEPCDFGYINTNWPTFLAHPDGFLRDRKTRKIVALAEVKSSHKSASAWKDEFSAGRVPEDYQDQVQAYMQVLGIDDCYVLAHSKHADCAEDFVYLHVARDEERAIKILDDCARFVAETAAGIEYNEVLLPDEAAHVYKDADETLGYVKLPRKTLGTLRKLEKLAKDKEALSDDIKDSTKLIRQIDAEEKKLRATLLPHIGNAQGGIIETSRAIYQIDVVRGFSLDRDVKQKIAEDYPKLWDEISSLKPTLRCDFKYTSKEEAPEEAV